jgi:hypothetical protein
MRTRTRTSFHISWKGEIGAPVGDEVVQATTGSYVFKRLAQNDSARNSEWYPLVRNTKVKSFLTGVPDN